jgi:hypothetical protein
MGFLLLHPVSIDNQGGGIEPEYERHHLDVI